MPKFYEHVTTNDDKEYIISMKTTVSAKDYEQKFRDAFDNDLKLIDENNKQIESELKEMKDLYESIKKEREGKDEDADSDLAILKQRIENLEKSIITVPEWTFKIVKSIETDLDIAK